MSDESAQSFAPDVVMTYVWDAIKEIPGVADLHRSPLQALGEKVHLERVRPVRLEEHDGRHFLEIHLIVRPGAVIPSLAERVRQAVTTYLKAVTGIEIDEVSVFVDDLSADPAAAT